MKTHRQDYREWARVLKALGNEARLMIVDRLNEGECSVGELTKLVGLDQSTVSKHLMVLRSHGIVADRRQGNVVYYRLRTPCVLAFFSCAGRVIEESRETAGRTGQARNLQRPDGKTTGHNNSTHRGRRHKEGP